MSQREPTPPEKLAQPEAEILDLLRRRWSPRAFAERDIAPADLKRLFEAARWSASAFNDQPWHFIVARKAAAGEDFARMLACLNEKNQSWARTAPVLAIGVCRLALASGGKPNRHAQYDLGQAVATLSAQATSMGILLHQMAGFDPARARETYGVPEGFEPLTAIALGYRGDPAVLADDLRQRESAARERKPVRAFTFSGSWNEPVTW